MKKFYNVLAILALPSILLLYSYNSGSPGGKSGSPGDGGSTCTDCHSGTAQSQFGWISSDIPAEGYTPGETYTITATGNHTGVVKFGFELTAEDAFGAKTGTLSITDPARTKFTNANKAVTHTSGGTSPSGSSSSWSMEWTAPASAPPVIKFYAAYNAANGNGMTSGDVIYTSSISYNLYTPPPPDPQITGVEPASAQQGYEGDINITGDATSWTLGVSEVRFEFHNNNDIFFVANDITIDGDDFITVNVSIPFDIEIGSYDVYVDELGLENGFVVDIYDDIDDNYLSDAVSVYPNPSADYVIVDAPAESQVVVLDISGRILDQYSTSNSPLKLNVSSYNMGLYFVQVTHEGNSITKKLLKQ